MIPTLLPPWLSGDLSLISGFLTWIVVLYWLWRSGWKIQRRYFIEATQKPLTRNAIVWSAGIVGAIFFVAAQMRPGMPGVMTVAMIGALSAYVDARTHRLPNAYTVAMGIGVVLGVIVGGVISPLWQERLLGALIGALIWFVPIALLNRLPAGWAAVTSSWLRSWEHWSVPWDCTLRFLPSRSPSCPRASRHCGRSSSDPRERRHAFRWAPG